MEQIISFLEKVKLARKQVYQNLSVFPPLTPDGIELDYLKFDQALDKNLIQIIQPKFLGLTGGRVH